MVIERTYTFKEILPYEKGMLKRGTYLGLFGIEGIPHLGLIRKGKYYSVSATKVKVGTPVDKLLEALDKRKVKSIFVEITSSLSKREVYKIFENFEKGLDKGQTCLKPIKQLFDLDDKSIEIVSDLLSQLNGKGALGKSYGFNTSKTTLSLMPYSKSDIDRMIKKMKSKK